MLLVVVVVVVVVVMVAVVVAVMVAVVLRKSHCCLCNELFISLHHSSCITAATLG